MYQCGAGTVAELKHRLSVFILAARRGCPILPPHSAAAPAMFPDSIRIQLISYAKSYPFFHGAKLSASFSQSRWQWHSYWINPEERALA
jgi:hypothetical protein